MLLKFAYDGTKFYGYQRQPDLPTVEGEILRVLRENGIAEDMKSASRTDRGVSALGNVILIHTNMEPRKVIGILNSNLDRIYFHSFSLHNLNPRHAEKRWYRYHLFDFNYDLKKLKYAARMFEGEHDFKNFTRARKNTVVRIDKISVKKEGNMIYIDFFARNYLWNLIRRLVAAMVKYASGMEFGEEIFEKRMNFGIAPPEPLVLMDVRYPFPFEHIGFPRRLREKMVINYLAGMVYLYLGGENYKSFNFI